VHDRLIAQQLPRDWQLHHPRGISHEESPLSQGIAYVDNDYPGAQESSFAPDESPQLRITFVFVSLSAPFLSDLPDFKGEK
jgi:hypothetical protein